MSSSCVDSNTLLMSKLVQYYKMETVAQTTEYHPWIHSMSNPEADELTAIKDWKNIVWCDSLSRPSLLSAKCFLSMSVLIGLTLKMFEWNKMHLLNFYSWFVCFVPGVCSPLDISDPREVPGHRLPLQQPPPRQASDRSELSHLIKDWKSVFVWKFFAFISCSSTL